MLLERLGTGMVAVWSLEGEAAWTLPRGARALEQGRVGYLKGLPKPTEKLGLGVQRM